MLTLNFSSMTTIKQNNSRHIPALLSAQEDLRLQATGAVIREGHAEIPLQGEKEAVSAEKRRNTTQGIPKTNIPMLFKEMMQQWHWKTEHR
jgi:hypothetical protein